MSSYQEIIVDSIGEFGRSQLLIMLACSAPKFVIAWSMMIMSYAGAQPDWWIFLTTNNTAAVIVLEKLPGKDLHVLDLDNTSTTSKWKNTCPQRNQTLHFRADMHTAVSEWNLVCGRDWIATAITTSEMVGVLVGAAVMGQLGDWLGRKRSIAVSYTLTLALIFILGFSVNWHMMLVCVFLLGFAVGGFLVLCNIYMLEFIGTRWRSFAGLMPFWSFGLLLFGVMFKLLPHWRHLCFATTIVGAPSLILLCISPMMFASRNVSTGDMIRPANHLAAYYRIAPRSIRWLLTHGRLDECEAVLRKIAKQNKMPPPDLSNLEMLFTEIEKEKNDKKLSYLSLFVFKSIRGKTLILAVIWFNCSFAYYGLTLGVGRLSGDISINMALMGLGELIAMGLVWLLSKSLGRKYTASVMLSLTAMSSLGITLSYFFSNNFLLMMNVLALLSRFFLSAAWASLILLTVETYPTVVRSVGYGFASTVARASGILAPQNKTLSKIAAHLPFTVNGVLTLIACFMCLLLSDTYTADMEDHIEEEKSCQKNPNQKDELTPLLT